MVDSARDLLDPKGFDVCLVCGGRKWEDNLTCRNCRGICPDPDCRQAEKTGKRTRSWEYDQCSDCWGFLSEQPTGQGLLVYLCDDGYVGFTGDIVERAGRHTEQSRTILWQTDFRYEDVFNAFKAEWTLKGIAVWSQRASNQGTRTFLGTRFELITDGRDPRPTCKYYGDSYPLER